MRSNVADGREFKGVRKRSWGKWVAEIRIPKGRISVWLGSYTTPEEAACAFDATSLCLRGPSAALNFADSAYTLHYSIKAAPRQIQRLVATTVARNDFSHIGHQVQNLNSVVADVDLIGRIFEEEVQPIPADMEFFDLSATNEMEVILKDLGINIEDRATSGISLNFQMCS